jgi:TusE/DsrC/DsvC family sulfur relay protein
METADKESGYAASHSTRVIDGVEVLFDEEGFFVHPESWTETAAVILAHEMGILELSERQWEMIFFLRDFYLTHGRSPLNKEIRKLTGVSLMELERLFPDGIRRGARLLAGLPNPKAC